MHLGAFPDVLAEYGRASLYDLNFKQVSKVSERAPLSRLNQQSAFIGTMTTMGSSRYPVHLINPGEQRAHVPEVYDLARDAGYKFVNSPGGAQPLQGLVGPVRRLIAPTQFLG
jgi:hypothetical protein